MGGVKKEKLGSPGSQTMLVNLHKHRIVRGRKERSTFGKWSLFFFREAGYQMGDDKDYS